MKSRRNMDWRVRLLRISLAGGLAASAVACSTNPAVPRGSCNANPDPCCELGDGAPQNVTLCAAQHDAAAPVEDAGDFACNANPDPCCERDGAPQDPVACAAGRDAASAADALSPADAGDAG